MQTEALYRYLIIFRSGIASFQVYDRRCGFCPNHDNMVEVKESVYAECPKCHTKYYFYPDEYSGCAPSQGVPLLQVPCLMVSSDRLVIGND